MIRDAVLAGLLPEQLLESRETATSTYLSALDNDEQATARLFIQKAAQAANESWQHFVSVQGPGVAGLTIASLGHPGSASQDDDSDDMDFSAPQRGRLSAPQLQAQLSRLTERTRLRRLKDTLLSVSRWIFHLDACAGSVLTSQDYITYVQKRLGNRIWEAVSVLRPLSEPDAGACRNLQHR